MKRIARLLFPLLFCLVGSAQTVTPVVQPHQTFVDASGAPCALCSLYSYAAGTTTPQPTYTDSTGTSQNTNPIILDVAGGANIWVSNTLAYKFVLVSATGTTIWTVDNVKSSGGGAVPCTTPYAVQFANSTATALACDPTITVNPTSHTLMVGGAITGPAFTLKNLSTITSSWTLDVTSPATALNSISPIPLPNLATENADTIVMNATAGPAQPTAVAMATGCMNGVNYSTATHTWTCALSSVPLSNLAPLGADTVVMNATGGTAAPTAIAMPSGCVNGSNYSTATHTWTCVIVPTAVDYYFSFTGCTLNVSGNSTNCQGSENFSSVAPIVPTQPDANYYLGCTTLTGVSWGSSTGVNSQSATGFQFAENVDRYNGIPANVTPTVWCHLHHN